MIFSTDPSPPPPTNHPAPKETMAWLTPSESERTLKKEKERKKGLLVIFDVAQQE